MHNGVEQAKDMADLKAISMNIMHKGIRTTDEVYSRLSDSDIHSRVGKLGKSESDDKGDFEETFLLFEKFLEWRRHEH